MTLQPETKLLLNFLQKNKQLHSRIAAAPNKTLLYAGAFFKPIWKEIEQIKRSDPNMADKEMLPDVLSRVYLTNHKYATFKDWLIDIDALVPWNENGFIAWRALSGIFASNAVGSVSFYIGSNVTKGKVFAITEINVLLRNQNLDQTTRDLIQYYKRCIDNKQVDINTGFISN